MKNARDIVAKIFIGEGGLVEVIEPDGLEVMAPPSLMDKLDIGEFTRFGFGPELPAGAARVHLESGWIEKLVALLGQRGSFLSVRANPLPSRARVVDLEKLVNDKIVFSNASYRIVSIEPRLSSYLVLSFHLTAISDEKRESILTVVLNESNRAYADHLVDPLLNYLRQQIEQNPARDPNAELPEPLSQHEVVFWTTRVLPNRIREQFAPFLVGMERRLTLDLDRLYTYHSDLRVEAAARLVEKSKKTGPESSVKDRDQLRLESIEREYFAKIEDLKRKYAMKINVMLNQVLRVVMPVERVSLNVLRRKISRPYHLDFNPLSRKLDQLPCESCGAVSATHHVCDDHAHIVCPACLVLCPNCQKYYCKACHSRGCPKCFKRGNAI